MTASDEAPRPVPPRLHIRPRRGWINDPNAVVRWNGRWHVFFQHNPYAAVHDRIHWGHVSSEDLVTWHEHPVAFGPEPGGPDRYGCWTGVFVTGLDRPAVAYSGVIDASGESTICLRYGSEDLETWDSPIIVGTTPHDAGVTVMRDPFVFSWRGRRWGILGARLGADLPAVLLYSCDDIENWEFVDVWMTGDGPLWSSEDSDMWECPQVVWVDEEPVVIISLQLEGLPGAVLAVEGSVTEEDGAPRFTPASVDRLDGRLWFYAPQAVQDQRTPLMFGWILQDNVPGDGDQVAGCLTFPRRLGRRADGTLVTRLDPAVDRLRTDPPTRVPAGSGRPLPAAAVVDVVSVATDVAGDIVLHGGGSTIVVPPVAGTTAWTDGEVVEVFPGDGDLPSAIRGIGAWPWMLEVPEGAEVTVTVLGLPSAAR